MNRREFIGWVGVGGVASSLPTAIAACSPTNTESKQSTGTIRADGFQAIGTVAELDKDGQILNKKFSGGSVLVIRDPANASQLIAVNPTCTHAGCTVAWQQDENAFVCPCHGSKYADDGKVIQDPAKKPLATYAARIEGDRILVKTV